jgi:ABC-type bacteriocin/lantibiotic exporter with double-glycine peptidase domain
MGVEILEGSILDNIRMGRAEIGISEIRDILDALRLADAIQSLPEGLNTQLTYQGLPLSPEQTRRLLLARAVAGRPRLLLIHELLDTLEASVQDEVIGWILRPGAPWTAIVATQSPRVMEYCDRVWQWNAGH